MENESERGRRFQVVTVHFFMFSSPTEAATRGVLWKNVFLEISQNSQKNTCLLNFKKRDPGTGIFL